MVRAVLEPEISGSQGKRPNHWATLPRGRNCMGQPLLRYKDVIKRDLRSALIDTSAWENITNHRGKWRQSVKVGVLKVEVNTRVQGTCKRAATKKRAAFHKARLRRLQQRLPFQDQATQSYKILPKSPALTIASLRRGCHYYMYLLRGFNNFCSRGLG